MRSETRVAVTGLFDQLGIAAPFVLDSMVLKIAIPGGVEPEAVAGHARVSHRSPIGIVLCRKEQVRVEQTHRPRPLLQELGSESIGPIGCSAIRMDDGVLVDRARLVEPKSVDVTGRGQPDRAADEEMPNHFVVELGSVPPRQIFNGPAVGLGVVARLSFVPEIDVPGRIVRIVRPLGPVAVRIEVVVANVENDYDSLSVARLDELP